MNKTRVIRRKMQNICKICKNKKELRSKPSRVILRSESDEGSRNAKAITFRDSSPSAQNDKHGERRVFPRVILRNKETKDPGTQKLSNVQRFFAFGSE